MANREKQKAWRKTPKGKEARKREWKRFYAKYKEKYKEYKLFLYQLRMDRGGKCSLCGYSKVVKILQFHHLRDKEFEVCQYRGLMTERVKQKILAEAEKCILLCPNCHWEITLQEIDKKYATTEIENSQNIL